MKKLLFIMAALLLAAGAARAEYPVGVSLGMVKVPEPEKLAQIKAAGIDHVEVVFNYFWRNAPENECYTRAYRVKAMLDEAGLTVWSCHLPFSRTLDISVLDPQRREENVLLMERMIRLAEIFHPQRLVLHPSSEPISDEEREELYKEAEALLAQECPVMPIYNYVATALVSERVKGFTRNANGHPNFEYCTIAE